MNQALWDAVVEKIQTVPESFNMNVWGRKLQNPGDGDPPCGTVACIGGWMCLLGGAERVYFTSEGMLHLRFESMYLGVEGLAAQLMDIPENILENLFHETEWPEDLYDKYIEVAESTIRWSDWRKLFAGVAIEAMARFKRDLERNDMSAWGAEKREDDEPSTSEDDDE